MPAGPKLARAPPPGLQDQGLVERGPVDSEVVLREAGPGEERRRLPGGAEGGHVLGGQDLLVGPLREAAVAEVVGAEDARLPAREERRAGRGRALGEVGPLDARAVDEAVERALRVLPERGVGLGRVVGHREVRLAEGAERRVLGGDLVRHGVGLGRRPHREPPDRDVGEAVVVEVGVEVLRRDEAPPRVAREERGDEARHAAAAVGRGGRSCRPRPAGRGGGRRSRARRSARGPGSRGPRRPRRRSGRRRSSSRPPRPGARRSPSPPRCGRPARGRAGGSRRGSRRRPGSAASGATGASVNEAGPATVERGTPRST